MVAERSGNVGFFRIDWFSTQYLLKYAKINTSFIIDKYIIDNLPTGQFREFPSKSRFFYRLAKG